MEKRIIFLGLLAFSIEVVWLLNEFHPLHFFSTSSSQNKKEMGQIVAKQNDVRVRPKQSLLWSDAQSRQDIFPYDSVLTANNSTAKLALKSGIELEVGEDSLIVIEPPQSNGGPIYLNVKKGTYRVHLEKSAKLQIGSTLIEPTSNVDFEFTVKDSNKNLQSPRQVLVVLKSGTANVTNTDTQIMSQNQNPPTANSEVQELDLTKKPLRQHKRAQSPNKTANDLRELSVKNDLSAVEEQTRDASSVSESNQDSSPVSTYTPEVPEVWKWSGSHRELWLGVGVNYISYSQTVPGVSSINSQGVASPSYYLLGDFQFGDKWGAIASYKNSPGYLGSNGNLSAATTEYAWQTINAEGSYLLTDHLFGNDKIDARIRIGAQQNYLPFLALDAGSVFNVHIVQMATAVLGGQLALNQNNRLRYEFLFHYQLPVSTSGTGGDTFKIQPRSAFDGSLGAAYKITRSWLVGLYWYGQINQYNYSFTNGNTGLATSGSQNVFYSNGELRIGHDF